MHIHLATASHDWICCNYKEEYICVSSWRSKFTMPTSYRHMAYHGLVDGLVFTVCYILVVLD